MAVFYRFSAGYGLHPNAPKLIFTYFVELLIQHIMKKKFNKEDEREHLQISKILNLNNRFTRILLCYFKNFVTKFSIRFRSSTFVFVTLS